MPRVLPKLLLAASLTGGAAMVSASDVLNAPTLADHVPAQMQDTEAGAEALVEQGQIAMLGMNFELAAQSYCQAARLNSAEGSYRLGRLLLQQRGLHRALGQARFVLGQAAALGNEDARALMATGAAFAGKNALRPGCMPERVHVELSPSGWVPPSFDPTALPVSTQVVERYLKQLTVERRTWAQRIQERAPFYGIDPRLALSVARAESNFDPNALSPAHAQGLMQLIPETALRFGAIDLHDPSQNIEAGLAYLRWLLLRFDHDVVKASAAYNAGEGAVDRYKGVPPYPETQAYVERILRFYRATVHTAPPAPSPQRAQPLSKLRPKHQG